MALRRRARVPSQFRPIGGQSLFVTPGLVYEPDLKSLDSLFKIAGLKGAPLDVYELRNGIGHPHVKGKLAQPPKRPSEVGLELLLLCCCR